MVVIFYLRRMVALYTIHASRKSSRLRRSLVIMESSIQQSHENSLFAHRISRCILVRRCGVAYLLRAD
jgi:hypothetical protein